MDFGSSHVYAGASEVYYSSVPKETGVKNKSGHSNASGQSTGDVAKTSAWDEIIEEPVYEAIEINKNTSKAKRPLPDLPHENLYDPVAGETSSDLSNALNGVTPQVPEKPDIYKSINDVPSLAEQLRTALEEREKQKDTEDETPLPPPRNKTKVKMEPSLINETPNNHTTTLPPAPVELAPKLPPRDLVHTQENSVKMLTSMYEDVKLSENTSAPVLKPLKKSTSLDSVSIPLLKPPPSFTKRRQPDGAKKTSSLDQSPHMNVYYPSPVSDSKEFSYNFAPDFSSGKLLHSQSSDDYKLSKTNPFSDVYEAPKVNGSDFNDIAVIAFHDDSRVNDNAISNLYPSLPKPEDVPVSPTVDLYTLSAPPLEPTAPFPSATLVKRDAEFLQHHLQSLVSTDSSDDFSVSKVTSLIRPSAPHLSQSMIRRDKENEAKPIKRSDSKESLYSSADTNIVCVKLGIVKQTTGSFVYKGLPTHCQSCGAITFSAEKDWTCRFCGVPNKTFTILSQNISENCQHDVTYVLEQATNLSTDYDSLVVFCIDTSGSMCVTSKVPSGSSNIFVSRLQGVKQAILEQLNLIEATRPNCRVALVAFSNEVLLLGDGSTEQLKTLTEFELFDFDYIWSFGANAALPGPIKSTRNQLNRTVNSLSEKGGTALGPALLLSTAIAAKRQGSQVIVCTDGRANVGVGSLETEDDYQMSQHFYSQATDLATSTGVIVSILSIAGTDCRLVQLGKIADKTAGKVNVVEATELSSEFQNVLTDKVLATNVSIDLVTHKQLYFNNEEGYAGCSLAQFVGNITDESEVTFRYGIKNFDGFENIAPPSEAPFQLKIMYRPPDGSVCMRVLTQVRPVTENRVLAETAMNPAVIGTFATQQAAKLALEGDIDHAKEITNAHKNLLTRAMSLRSNAGSVNLRFPGEEIYEAVRSRMDDVGAELSKVEVESESSEDDRSHCYSIEEETYEPLSDVDHPPELPPRLYLQDGNRSSSGLSSTSNAQKKSRKPKLSLTGSLKRKKSKNKQKTAMQYKDETAQKMFKFAKAGTKNFLAKMAS
ncbi:uncharacterized protein LOC143462264 isoform X1 [Clavelina lepadiformis]|uniref:uncharacterized protein LOC143462264 isoform X1 n=1 Tax=Clavelina lepadiformis TaxID=159417 RepID=UPI0040430428